MRNIIGYVEHGDARGRQLGFPTANIALNDDDDLDGVWASTVHLEDGRSIPATVSIGRRVTFYGTVGRLLLEAYLLDFNENLYGQRLTVELQHYLRPQWSYDRIEDLVDQLHRDVTETRRWLNLPAPDTRRGEHRMTAPMLGHSA